MEEQTFNKLRQHPIDEVLDHLRKLTMPPSLMAIGSNVVDRNTLFPDIVFHFERIELLKKYGWSLEEFVLGIEKRAIIMAVKMHTDSIGDIPIELINRATAVFPKFRIIPARIEFE